MRTEKGKISSFQLIFIIAGFMQGTMFVTTYTFSNAPRDEWLITLITYALFLSFALLYIKLSEKFPNDNFFGILEKVFGAIAGRIVSFIYCIYFIVTTSGQLRFPSNFLNVIFMIETPVLAFAFCLLILCAFTVRGGIEAIARVGLFTTVSILSAFVLYFVMLLNKMEIQHFFPILDVPPLKVLQNVHILISQYMGETFILSMLLPCVSDRTHLKRNYLIGTAAGAFTLFLVALLVTSVLGTTASVFSGPLVQTTRLVEILNINARTEFIFMGFLTFSAFYKSCLFFYVALISVAELFRLRSHTVLIVPLGLLVFSLVMTCSENSATLAMAGRNGWAFLSLIMLFILPLITFFTALIRGLPNTQSAGGESA